ncbi:Hypothetical_protein [Hexamita inflata]|uniref:Hypothetical_protein n=1 Tax=Hexamita inflata TaxID=28002 RepID=A0AA86R5B6_9EUKA|nr:Hypothetical protein HINF_LOCUS57282 [Hexamita inflata]
MYFSLKLVCDCNLSLDLSYKRVIISIKLTIRLFYLPIQIQKEKTRQYIFLPSNQYNAFIPKSLPTVFTNVQLQFLNQLFHQQIEYYIFNQNSIQFENKYYQNQIQEPAPVFVPKKEIDIDQLAEEMKAEKQKLLEEQEKERIARHNIRFC